MTMTRRLEALERLNPYDPIPLERLISQKALEKLSDQDLTILMAMQQKTRLNSDYVPTNDEVDAMLTYIHLLEAVGSEGSEGNHASKS